MPETLRKNKFGLYWPTIAAAFTVVGVGVVVSRVQKSPMFAVTSSLIMLLAFGAVYWRERSDKSRLLESSQPVPLTLTPNGVAKPEHNVQCLGVRTGDRAADIGFVNVEIPSREVAIFSRAKLKIRYSVAGKQVEIVFPARWIGSNEYETSIGFVPEYAVLAVYIGNEWFGVETEDVPMTQAEIEFYYRRKLKPLPTAELSIEATLIGENNLSLSPLTGTLTLRKDGTASFYKDA
jgi:hypothetical protein